MYMVKGLDIKGKLNRVCNEGQRFRALDSFYLFKGVWPGNVGQHSTAEVDSTQTIKLYLIRQERQ